MTDESPVVNVRRPKRLFTKRDLWCVLKTLSKRDDPIFNSERSRIQFAFTFLKYYWTGARLGAFFTEAFATGSVRYNWLMIRVADRRMPTSPCNVSPLVGGGWYIRSTNARWRTTGILRTTSMWAAVIRISILSRVGVRDLLMWGHP